MSEIGSTVSQRDRQRARALKVRMKENLRQSFSARIQRQFNMPPKEARKIADAVVGRIRGIQPDISDAELTRLVKEQIESQAPMSSRRNTGNGQQANNVEQLVRRASKQQAVNKAMASKGVRGRGPNEEELRRMAEEKCNYLPDPSRMQRSKNDIWNDLVNLNALEEAEERQKNVERKAREQAAWKGDLANQVKQKQDQYLQRREEATAYHQAMQSDLEKWKDEEAKRQNERKEQLRLQSLDQQQQRAMSQLLREEEERLRRQEEESMVSEIKRQLEDEEEREKRQRAREKRKMDLLKAANDRVLHTKAEERRREREHERRLAQEYMEMEERKEAEREKWLADQSERIKAKMEMGAQVMEEVNNRAQEDEERAMREQARYEKEREVADEQKRRAARIRAEEQHRQLRAQIDEKHYKEAQERAEMVAQAEVWRRETNEALRADKQAEREKMERNMRQKLALENQIREKTQSLNEPDQTELELQLNRQLLNKAQAKGISPKSKAVGGAGRIGDGGGESTPFGNRAASAEKALTLGERTRARSRELVRQQNAGDKRLMVSGRRK